MLTTATLAANGDGPVTATLWGSTLAWTPHPDGTHTLTAADETQHQITPAYHRAGPALMWRWRTPGSARYEWATSPVRDCVKLVRAAEAKIIKRHGGPKIPA